VAGESAVPAAGEGVRALLAVAAKMARGGGR
jgi:hypothetical protein